MISIKKSSLALIEGMFSVIREFIDSKIHKQLISCSNFNPLKEIRIYEFTTSFRAYNHKCLKILNKSSIKSNGYSCFVEFLFYIYKSGLKCNEIPIKFSNRFKGNSKIPRLQIIFSALKLIELFFKNIIIRKKKL